MEGVAAQVWIGATAYGVPAEAQRPWCNVFDHLTLATSTNDVKIVYVQQHMVYQQRRRSYAMPLTI